MTSARLLPCLLLAACTAADAAPRSDRIEVNDNRRPAGTGRGGEQVIDLELGRGRWYPEADDGPSLDLLALRERGGPLRIPSPAIRVREGTRVRLRVRNALPDRRVVLYGLDARPGSGADSLPLAPGETGERRFVAGEPGTYFYWGTTTGRPLEEREGEDSQIGGAFIVDPAVGGSAERVFVIGSWFRPPDTTVTPAAPARDVMTINGKAWPHTERFAPALGDTVRWRWINTTGSSHPMHLHGFYFDVESRGDGRRDTAYAAADRPRAVTELMPPGGTMLMRWVPERPGNWLFHCHFAFHVSPFVSLTRVEAAEAGTPLPHDLEHGMSGLVLAISVPPGGYRAPAHTEAVRDIRLLAQRRERVFGAEPGYGFVTAGAGDPARDSIEIPGRPIVLKQGSPVRITVVNRLPDPTGVHWHGVELESAPDGVPGWSGIGDNVMAPVAPGDSFAAEFSPPRSGTFIYHAHAHEMVQLAQGMYGALLVTPDGRLDSITDHTVLVSLDGPGTDTAGGFVNGSVRPRPIALAPGRENRLRLINIDIDHRVRFTLLQGGAPARWRALAKDGADLPAHRAVEGPGTLLTGPGETADFGVTPAAGDSLTLRVEGPFATRPWRIDVPLRSP